MNVKVSVCFEMQHFCLFILWCPLQGTPCHSIFKILVNKNHVLIMSTRGSFKSFEKPSSFYSEAFSMFPESLSIFLIF